VRTQGEFEGAYRDGGGGRLRHERAVPVLMVEIPPTLVGSVANSGPLTSILTRTIPRDLAVVVSYSLSLVERSVLSLDVSHIGLGCFTEYVGC